MQITTIMLLRTAKLKRRVGLLMAKWRLLANVGSMMEADKPSTITELNCVGYIRIEPGPPMMFDHVRNVSLNTSA